jgi:dTDP-glucose 4,6-dehydratase
MATPPPRPQRVLVTGAAGFIGNAFLRGLLAAWPDVEAMTFDALTYAGHLENLEDLPGAERHTFRQGDVAQAEDVERAFADFAPQAVVHLAAETHVDRSILDPAPFLRTNVHGTQVLLDACRTAGIRLVLISTDEVYGDRSDGVAATPTSPLRPSNPYAATKAAGDLLALAAWRTHGQDVVITRGTNNYGPRQVPEKLIPLMTLRAHAGESLPVYGDGLQVRDWLHVEDHAAGLLAALERGEAGGIYHFAANHGRTNLDIVRAICAAVGTDESKIEHVEDRPGHDRLYTLDDAATRLELAWTPRHDFTAGIAATVAWYLANPAWCRAVAGEGLTTFLEANYGSRQAAARPE